MKKNYLLLLLILVFPLLAEAQSTSFAKIQLKNGSKLKGNILESIDETGIVLRLDSATLKIHLNEVKSIRFYDSSKKRFIQSQTDIEAIGHKTSGFFHSIKGGVVFGDDNTNVNAHTVNGIMFKERFGAGVGIGYDQHNPLSTLPIYAHLRGYLKQGKVSPYYFADLGYANAWDNSEDQFVEVHNVDGGLFFQTGMGLQVNYKGISMVWGVAWRSQKSQIDYSYYNYWPTWNSFAPTSGGEKISEKRSIRGLEVSLGLLF
ncbi:hypothetical protein R9C00_22085 [Flammeovirgaceae bacterium SG7u.111]|nr:hypothetical protein [Flammeovirgaceae bacterium SG7u.132]WPO34394.1 hypothetical protein R9C00_22085 [Flammeovirgaceae bacterium SG7u.111]